MSRDEYDHLRESADEQAAADAAATRAADPTTPEGWQARYVAEQERWLKVVEARHPGLHPVTAHIMAQDMATAERATQAVLGGDTARHASILVGSYARWDWALAMLERGAYPWVEFLEDLPVLWTASDPDDTDPGSLEVWLRARRTLGSYVRDGRPLPRATRGGTVTIYRGGATREATAKGFAWSTNPKVARKFALGADTRVPRSHGWMVRGQVRPADVLAYLTGRDEAEVIVPASRVRDLEIKAVAKGGVE